MRGLKQKDMFKISDLRRRKILHLRPVCPLVPKAGEGVILIFSLGFKILNFKIFWGFQRTEYFFGYEDFVDIFLEGHHIIGRYLEVISMHFRVFSGAFSEGQGTEWRKFFGLLKYQIFIWGT